MTIALCGLSALFSLAYLFLHFGALLVEASLQSFGMAGW